MLYWITALFIIPATFASTESELRQIQNTHERAKIPDKAPLVVDALLKPDQLKLFSQESCSFSVKPTPEEAQDCDQKYKARLIERLRSTYFAASEEALKVRCQSDALACKDPKILEYFFRQSHNSEIDRSLKEKLARAGQRGIASNPAQTNPK